MRPRSKADWKSGENVYNRPILKSRMQETNNNKSTIRRQLREQLAEMTEPTRHAKSVAACSLIIATPEFAAARVVMVYLSTPTEVDTTNLAIRAWKTGKTVVVPKVSWDQRRMLPV